MAPRVSPKALMIGSAVCYILGLIAFEAMLFTAVDSDVSVAFLYTALASAAIPAVAYGVGYMVSRGSSVPRFVILCLVYTIFYQSAGHHFLGFYGALSYSILAAGVIFAAKIADATDKRFRIWNWVCTCLSRGFGESLWWSDYASATCFAMAIVLGFVVLWLDVDAPAPGSIHDLLAPRHHSALPVFSGKEDVKIQNENNKDVKHTNGDVLSLSAFV